MDRIARAVEPSLGYRHQIPEASEEPTVGSAMSNAACDLAEALGAQRDPRADVQRPDRLERSRGCARGGRSSALTHHQTARPADGARVGRDAAARSPSAPTSRSSGRCRSRPRASAGLVESRRPRRDHRRHGGEHPRLDERDQGRHRLTGSSEGGRSAAAKSRAWSSKRGRPQARARPALACGRGALVLVALLYYRPLQTYSTTRRPSRSADARGPAAAGEQLSSSSGSSQRRRATRLSREARRARPRQAGRAPVHRQGDRRLARSGTGTPRPGDGRPRARRAAARARRRARSGASRSAARSVAPAVTEQARSTSAASRSRRRSS